MDETLNETASLEEQPVEEAVEGALSAEPEQPVEQEASAAEQPSFQTRMFAGKYKDADELERAYLESQREASRMAGELSALRRGADAGRPEGRGPEPEWKQLEAQRNQWAQQLRRMDLSDQDRWQAEEQVRLHDREIAYKRAMHDFSEQSTKQSASQALQQESAKVLDAYKQDLSNQTSPLYQAAAQRYQQLVLAGHPKDTNTEALAVAYAAAVTGTTVNKAVRQDRSAMLQTLNANMKKAVVTGAGGPAAIKSGHVTAKDIDRMSPAEFAKFEREMMGV